MLTAAFIITALYSAGVVAFVWAIWTAPDAVETPTGLQLLAKPDDSLPEGRCVKGLSVDHHEDVSA